MREKGENKLKASHAIHPKGIQAKVLLSSVFGPFAQDDPYGSRAINPMEHGHMIIV